MGTKKLVVGLIAITALTFTALGAGSASAAEFSYSKFGKLKGSADTSQEFEVSAGGGEYILCDKLSITGEVATFNFTKQAVVVQYEECKATTFLGELSTTISAADYTLDANGSVEITKPIEINIGGLVTQTVTDQTVSSVTYSNSNPISTIMINANVTGIHSEGGLGTQTTGVYGGESLLSLEGGTMEWRGGGGGGTNSIALKKGIMNFGEVSLAAKKPRSEIDEFESTEDEVKYEKLTLTNTAPAGSKAFSIEASTKKPCGGNYAAKATCEIELTLTPEAPTGTVFKATLELEYEDVATKVKNLKTTFDLEGKSAP